MQPHSVLSRSWGELSTVDVYSFARLRSEVFLREQKVDDLEFDGRDLEPTARHWWVADEQGMAAYLRTLVDERPEHLDARRVVGRVVTRVDRRGEGLAHLLLQAVLARYGGEALLLHAQVRVAGLYERSGFVAFGDEYVEAGIPHVSMYRSASTASDAALPTLRG
ncbi:MULTISPECIES: GNAT family N-acetyltransferase [unclassified Rathayibacter]|uniref:GNAT family N-acetyltransferase n=1 Tax=unclassified Rathayibacter TaxID=2609250 RepID=UPI00188D263E|nr:MULTISPECIES: GNAT family N-acetyltransferase [unclassified Rathayibacter]MBF4461728.1 GNAT family N-acetyltransferase [Rathayibacter sp. VKM Ac-2879]MBF4503139.1 GNAT family N-acetyltransferase [Rathayibacter sp. VKM Ac-2878]